MAKMLYIGLSGSESPTRAAFPLIYALGAKEAGHDVQIHLSADAVVLMKDVVANSVVPVGWPPFKELLQKVIGHGIPIYV